MLSEQNYVKQIDPRLDLTRPVKIRIEEGGANINVTKYPASSQSATNIQFNNINPPSADTIVDRKVMVKAAFRLRFTGTNVPNTEFLLQTSNIDGTGELVGGVDALRAFPLSQIMQSITLKINNQTYTQNINQYLEAVMRYSNNRDVGEQDWSMTPTEQDQYKQYSDFVQYGSARNVLGNYGESAYYTPRGGFSGLFVTAQTASTGLGSVVTATVDFEVTEPIFISPLAFGKRSHRGFVGVKTMAITMNLDANYANFVWSHDETSSGKIISNIELDYGTTSPGFASRPEIMFTYLTSRLDQEMPLSNIYPYHQINDYTTENSGSIAPGASQQVTVNNIQLDSVPKRLYVFLSKRPADKTYNDTDTYARIKDFNLTFGNKSGLLTDANEQQLYLMSVRNGLKSSWTQWSKHVGSVLCIDFARDVSLDPRNVVGRSGSYQLQYKLTVENVSASDEIYEIHTVVVNDGYIDIDAQTVTTSSNLGDVDLIYDSSLIHIIDWEEMDMFYGAGIADRIRSLGHRAKDFYHKMSPTLKKAAKLLAKAARRNGDLEIAAMAESFAEDGFTGFIQQFGPRALKELLKMIPEYGDDIGSVAEDALLALEGAGVVGGGVVGGKHKGELAVVKSVKNSLSSDSHHRPMIKRRY